MRSPGWKFATCEIGSDLPFRETFISTRGPSRSKGATSAASVRDKLAPNAAASSATNPIFLIALAWEARNTPASLSGQGLCFSSEIHRATIIALQENTPRISATKFSERANESSVSRRVVALARKDLVVLVGSFYPYLAELAVSRSVRRIVAERVLAAQLFGDLIERFVELSFRRNVNHAAAGFVSHLPGDVAAAIAIIVNVKDMDHRIGPLSGFNRLFHAKLAALILRIRNDDQRLASGFRCQHIVARQINGVIEMSSAKVRGNRPRSHYAAAHRADARLIDCALQLTTIVGEIG